MFQNLNKIRTAGAPFNKVRVTHDLTRKQKEGLKDKIEEGGKRREMITHELEEPYI